MATIQQDALTLFKRFKDSSNHSLRMDGYAFNRRDRVIKRNYELEQQKLATAAMILPEVKREAIKVKKQFLDYLSSRQNELLKLIPESKAIVDLDETLHLIQTFNDSLLPKQRAMRDRWLRLETDIDNLECTIAEGDFVEDEGNVMLPQHNRQSSERILLSVTLPRDMDTTSAGTAVGLLNASLGVDYRPKDKTNNSLYFSINKSDRMAHLVARHPHPNQGIEWQPIEDRLTMLSQELSDISQWKKVRRGQGVAYEIKSEYDSHNGGASNVDLAAKLVDILTTVPPVKSVHPFTSYPTGVRRTHLQKGLVVREEEGNLSTGAIASGVPTQQITTISGEAVGAILKDKLDLPVSYTRDLRRTI